MEFLSFRITEAEAGKPIRWILRQRLGLSATLLRRLKQEADGILLDGKRVFVTVCPAVGQELCVKLADTATPSSEIRPCTLPLDLLWEDELLAVVNKPAGIAVHPSSLDPDAPTLAGALLHHYGAQCVPHFVNRLDRGTSGLLVVAKNSFCHSRLQEQLHSGAFFRVYRAVVWGHPQPDSGTIDAPIGRDESSLLKRCITPDGARAVTQYRVLEQTERFSLVELHPQTGRTHQLRLHLASIGHPMVGDWLYGQEEPEWIARPALHSHQLRLTHPLSGEVLPCIAPLPPDMEQLLSVDTQ